MGFWGFGVNRKWNDDGDGHDEGVDVGIEVNVGL